MVVLWVAVGAVSGAWVACTLRTLLDAPHSVPAPTPHPPPTRPLARRVGGDAAKQRKVAALQNEVSGLEAALEAARREYERVKARNLQVKGWAWNRHMAS